MSLKQVRIDCLEKRCNKLQAENNRLQEQLDATYNGEKTDWAIELAETNKRLQAEVDSRDKYIAELEAGLNRISGHTDCIGPGCPYCEDNEIQHPPTAGARLAQQLLNQEA